MKKILLLVITIFVLACEAEDAVPENPVIDNFDPSMAQLIGQGMITGIGHTASGTAQVFEQNGKFTVVLDPFSSENGPDLKVYLSKDANATEYVRLGDLKSTMGRQSYEVPGTPDIDEYPFVHVWCEKFSVVFARAEIQ
jgi:hypothetical protein